MEFNEDDFSAKKADRLESVPSKFASSMSSVEKKVLQEMEMLVSTFDTEGGSILLNEKNMAIMDSINKRLKDIIFDDVYAKNLTEFIGEFNTQAGLNNQYFKFINKGDFEVTKLYETTLRSSQRNAIELLNEDAFTQVLISPIKSSLEASVTSNQQLSETINQLRFIIQGEDNVDGRLMSHVKRVAYDSFAVSDRSYTNIIATDLALVFGKYAGQKVTDTRCFCSERKGKYFHRQEVADWGSGKDVGACGYPWAGMNRNTDSATIFYYLGGYNCLDHFLPVSLRSVPGEVVQRAVRKGIYSV